MLQLSEERDWVIVLVRVNISIMKHHDQNNRGWKGFIQITLPHCCSSLKGVRTGTLTGQECEGRSWCTDHGGVLLTGLLLMASSACFFLRPPTMCWALLHSSLIKKMPYSWILWRHFLNWGSLRVDDSSLYQADIRLASTVTWKDTLPEAFGYPLRKDASSLSMCHMKYKYCALSI